MPSILSSPKFCHLVKCQLFPKRQILDSSKLKELTDDNFKFVETGRKFSKRIENNVGKGEIAPSPTVFSKDFYCRQVKTRACWGKS